MRTKDVKVGSTVYTNVSGERVAVRVVRTTEKRTMKGTCLTRFVVARVDNGRELPQARTASALHAAPTGEWGGLFDTAGDEVTSARVEESTNHLVSDIGEVPPAPFYVVSVDKFMSGWGGSDGKLNIVILPCGDEVETRRVRMYVRTRPEMQEIHVYSRETLATILERGKNTYTFSLMSKERCPRWYAGAQVGS